MPPPVILAYFFPAILIGVFRDGKSQALKSPLKTPCRTSVTHLSLPSQKTGATILTQTAGLVSWLMLGNGRVALTRINPVWIDDNSPPARSGSGRHARRRPAPCAGGGHDDRDPFARGKNGVNPFSQLYCGAVPSAPTPEDRNQRAIKRPAPEQRPGPASYRRIFLA